VVGVVRGPQVGGKQSVRSRVRQTEFVRAARGTTSVENEELKRFKARCSKQGG